MSYQSDAELIAAITGLSQFKSHAFVKKLSKSNPMAALLNVNLEQMGLTPAQAKRLRAALELGRRSTVGNDKFGVVTSADCIWGAVKHELPLSVREKCAVVVMDVGLKIIASEIVSEGTATECWVCPREVIACVLKHGGTRFAIAHNHPSGSRDPSNEDVVVTKELIKAAELMNLQLIDHLVVTRDGYTSIRGRQPGIWGKHHAA